MERRWEWETAAVVTIAGFYVGSTWLVGTATRLLQRSCGVGLCTPAMDGPDPNLMS